MDRRQFLLTSCLAGVNLFLPKTFQPTPWKRFAPLWDYQIALYHAQGEVAGVGYRRALLNLKDFDKTLWFPRIAQRSLNKRIAFLPAGANWGEIISVGLLNRQGERIAIAPVYPRRIASGLIVEFPIGGIVIHDTANFPEFSK